MTRRERMEARAERFRGWASKRKASAAAVFESGEQFRGDTAFNTQPGHIPERARLIAREHRAFRSLEKAEGMDARAASIERQAERAIFSDDPDAPERLTKKISALEERRETMKRANRAFRRGGIAAVVAECGEQIAEEGARTLSLCHWEKVPFPPYAITNLGANIRRLRERLAGLVATAEAEGASVAEAVTP